MTASVTAPVQTDDASDNATLSSARIGEVLGRTGERPSPPGRAATILAFLWRGTIMLRRNSEEIIGALMFPIMFLLMFTYIFGGALEGSTDAYIQFLIPGIIVQSILFMTQSTGATLAQQIEKGVFDRFRSLRIWQPASIVALLCVDAIRYVVSTVALLVVGMLMGYRPDSWPGVFAAVALTMLFAFSLSWAWTLLGLTMRSFQAVLNISMMILFPLTFLSSVFVRPETMPSLLETIVELNPVTHLADAARDLADATASASDIALVLVECVVLVAIFAPLTMMRFRRQS